MCLAYVHCTVLIKYIWTCGWLCFISSFDKHFNILIFGQSYVSEITLCACFELYVHFIFHHQVAQFTMLPEPMLNAFLEKYKQEEEEELQEIIDK